MPRPYPKEYFTEERLRARRDNEPPPTLFHWTRSYETATKILRENAIRGQPIHLTENPNLIEAGSIGFLVDTRIVLDSGFTLFPSTDKRWLHEAEWLVGRHDAERYETFDIFTDPVLLPVSLVCLKVLVREHLTRRHPNIVADLQKLTTLPVELFSWDDWWEKQPMPNKRSMPKITAAFNAYFDKLEARFPDFGELELHHDEKAGGDNGHGADRQFGYCTVKPPFQIAFAAKTEQLPVAYIRGLMAHEMGHAIDHRYGKQLPRLLGEQLPKSAERRADRIAEIVFGEPIQYGSDLLIQCVNCQGVSPRPRKLG